MANYSSDLGLLYPSEAGFRGPGRYGEFLQAQGSQRASYLAEMDQFFASLTEQQRQFDATLGFKEKELASKETLTKAEFDLQRELQDEQLEYQRWMIGETTKSNEKIANIKNQQPTYLGGPSRSDIWEETKANNRRRLELLDAGLTGVGRAEMDRFYMVDYSSGGGNLRAAKPGELSYLGESKYGQGSSGALDFEQPTSPYNSSGVSNFTEYDELYQ